MVKSLISAGFVASHMADLLLEKDEQVYVYHRWSDDLSSFDHIKDKVNFVLMDLNDLSSCIKAIEEVKPDYIYHFGAQSSVPASFAYPKVTLETNVVGTYNLLEAIRITKQDPTIIIVSSSEVYGQVDEEFQPINENCAFNPNNPYGVSKCAEDLLGLIYYKNHNLKVIRTRFFTHTGPRRTMMSAECFYAKAIAEIEKGAIPKISIGNMHSIRTFADVRDAVKAYYELARNGEYGEAYNIGGETIKSIQEVLDTLIELSDLNKNDLTFETDFRLLRKADINKQTVDISKFKKVCPNWKPEYSFKQTMQDLLDWWREQI